MHAKSYPRRLRAHNCGAARRAALYALGHRPGAGDFIACARQARLAGCRIVAMARDDDNPLRRRAQAPLTFIDGLTVGLFTASPSPEGGDIKEVTSADYARQMITFMRDAKVVLPSASRVIFAPVLTWPQARFVGLFKPDGGLLASGRLKTSPGPAGHDEATFAASSIRLRFI